MKEVRKRKYTKKINVYIDEEIHLKMKEYDSTIKWGAVLTKALEKLFEEVKEE